MSAAPIILPARATTREIGTLFLERHRHSPGTWFCLDVFDTLVHRRCTPEAVTRAVLRDAVSILKEAGIAIEEAGALRARGAALARAVASSRARGLDGDTTLEAWCRIWADQMAPSLAPRERDLVAGRLQAAEEAYEREACVANPDMLEACRTLAASGARLAFVSDMYLSAAAVRSILDACGYAGMFEQGFTSGDEGYLKRTGRLFPRVAERLGVGPGGMVHAGDDPEADLLRPRRAGVEAVLLEASAAHARTAHLRAIERAGRRNPALRGLAGLAHAAVMDRPSGDPAPRVGRGTIGPVLVPFLHGVLDTCRERGIGKVFFLAREGLVLKRAFEALSAGLPGPAVETAYLGVSRLPALLASMPGGYGLREVGLVKANGTPATVASLFAPLRLRDGEVDELARRYGFAGTGEAVDPVTDSRFHHLLADQDFQAGIRARSAAARKGLIAHLEALGFFDHDRVAVVDVGWGGQIQEGIELAIADRPDRPEIHGLYLGADRRAIPRRSAGMRIDAKLSDEATYDWVGGALFDFVAAFELATRAPHGSVVGHEADGTPILAACDSPSRSREAADDAALAALQEGVVSYAGDYVRAIALHGLNSGETLGGARLVAARLLRLPRPDETSVFARLTNASNLGSEEVRRVDAGDRREVGLVGALRTAMWKEAVGAERLGFSGSLLVAVLKGARRRLPAVPAQARLPAPDTRRPVSRMRRLDADQIEAWHARAEAERVAALSRRDACLGVGISAETAPAGLPVTPCDLLRHEVLGAAVRIARRILFRPALPMATPGLASVLPMTLRPLAAGARRWLRCSLSGFLARVS